MIPIFFQFTRSDSPLEAGEFRPVSSRYTLIIRLGVRLLPYIFLMVFAVILNGALLSKTGLYWPWYTVGGLFIIAGGALMFTVDSGTSTSKVYGYTILIGFGVGCFAQASFSVAQAVVTRQGHPHLIPLAVGFITCAQVGGVTIALAIANSVFLNKSKEGIMKVLPDKPKSQIEAAIAGAAGDFLKTLSSTQQTGVIDAIVDAQQNTYPLVITAGCLAVVLSLVMKKERLFVEAAAGAA